MKRKLGKYYKILQKRGIKEEKTWINPKKLRWGEGFHHPNTAILTVDIRRSTNFEIKHFKNSFIAIQLFYYLLWQLIYPYKDCFIEKQTGDGLILAYPVDNTAFTLKPLELAQNILSHIKQTLNPFLKEINIEHLTVSIGIDMGEIIITKVGFPYEIFQFMTFGYIPNFASKISKVGNNEILIGGKYYDIISSLKQYDWTFIKYNKFIEKETKIENYSIYKAIKK